MKKFIILGIIAIVFLTGCGKKTCVQWTTKDTSNAFMCERVGGSYCSTTQECTKWE